jgi:DNA-directed RNA polymerase subunit RPC12/RpoP
MQTRSEIRCKECHSTNTTRSTRKTFFERVILLRLGLHPWKCLTCKNRFFTRDRGPKKQSDQDLHSRAGTILRG